jgi:hypothetical protein
MKILSAALLPLVLTAFTAPPASARELRYKCGIRWDIDAWGPQVTVPIHVLHEDRAGHAFPKDPKHSFRRQLVAPTAKDPSEVILLVSASDSVEDQPGWIDVQLMKVGPKKADGSQPVLKYFSGGQFELPSPRFTIGDVSPYYYNVSCSLQP